MNRILSILLLISLAGCSYPSFLHPIVEPQDALRFDELNGIYQAQHPDTSETFWLHIGRCRDGLPIGFHKFVWVSSPAPTNHDQGLSVGEYMGFIFNNGDSYIVQIPFTSDCGDQQAAVISRDWGKKKIESYYIFRLKKIGNVLRLDLLHEENLEQLVLDHTLAGRIEQKIDETTEPPTIGLKSVIVTAESDELTRFFTNHNLDTLFKPSGHTFKKLDAR